MQGADVGNARLEAVTTEKVCFINAPEFGERAGHTFIVCEALPGLRTSGARCREKFADALRLEGFFPCCADLRIWMRDAGDMWEHICTHVDDLATCLKDPQALFDVRTGPKHNCKFKVLERSSVTFQ